jgi:putative ABC transport system permease protein
MLVDLRYAVRQLWKNPAFAALAIATLSLGIGTAAAMFGLIQGALLTPPPYDDPAAVVLVRPARTDGQPFDRAPAVAHWAAWRETTSIERPALYRWTFNFLVRDDGSESMGGMVVTTNFFGRLGLRPMLGRTFVDAEAGRPDVPPSAIILGYERWQRSFGGDPGIVGRTVRLSRMPAPLPVIGVMPPGVRFLPDPGAAAEPNYDLHATVDFWLARVPDESRPTSGAGFAITRLKPGRTLEQARAELAALTARVGADEPTLKDLTADVRFVEDVLNAEGRALLVPLMGSVMLVFLIAVANVAGLLLAKGLQRQSEYVVRSALGAGRWRLYLQVTMEAVVLAAVGAGAGAALAAGLIALMRAVGGSAIPRLESVSPGWPVVAFGLGAALASAILASILPALRIGRSDRLTATGAGRTTAGRAERRLIGAVATVQVVLTIALLSAAGLLVRSAFNLRDVRPGYDTAGVLTMSVTAMERDNWQAFHSQALERVAALPGVVHAAFAWGVPLTGNKWPGEIQLGGVAEASREVDRISVPIRAVTADYFDTLGMALVEGRAFRASDDDKASRVAIVNEAFVRQHVKAPAALGRTLAFPGQADRPLAIVGIVADTRTTSLGAQPEPEVYLPLWQSRAFSKHLVVRASGEPLALAALVRRALRSIDPTAAVEHVTTLDEIRRESVAPATFAMRLLLGFAAIATVLALVGLYGVVSLAVGSRTKELAIRAAIGATAGDVVALMLRETGRLVLVGVVCGALAAYAVGRMLQALLFEVSAADPIALLTASGAFALAAFVVCARPAWRAGRIDITKALRQE